MKNMKISKKLFVIFGSTIAMFILTVILCIIGLSYGNSKFRDFYTYSYPLSNQTLEMRRAIQAAVKNLSMSMLTENEQEIQYYVNEASTQMGLVNDCITFFKENYRGDLTEIEKAEDLLNQSKEYRVQVAELSEANQNIEAVRIFFDQYVPIMDQIQEKLVALDTYTDELADTTYSSASTAQFVFSLLAIFISIAVLIIMIFLAVYLTRSLTKPITEIETVAKEMVAGSLDVTLKYESQDELGSLSNSIRLLCGNLKEIIVDIGNILGELADGNFHITSNCLQHYKGDYVPILTAMRLIRDNLDEALTKINQSAEQVSFGSVQLAESAQSLAEGATEQAGAVEELTATVESVSSISENNAKATQAAAAQISEAEENAAKSQEDLKALTDAMVRISDASREIQNIISSIEDIASQTNLLSLNASIEAARAGEAGKGFAVVADQIGKLASDSAQSAVSTRELIEKSLTEINAGNQITEKTVETIKEVLSSMHSFASLAKESGDNSKQQAEMLKQVEQGIEQISKVVQNNSASAEETSATSEELSAQAEELKRQVEKFHLLEQS